MKYCTNCGAALEDSTASFCAESANQKKARGLAALSGGEEGAQGAMLFTPKNSTGKLVRRGITYS